MPAKKYHVDLTSEERAEVERVSTSKQHSIRERTRARILLAADRQQTNGGESDEQIVARLRTSRPTIVRVRQRFAEGGLDAALYHKEQARRVERMVDGAGEAFLIALVCGAPPQSHKRWSLRLLADRYIEAGYAAHISHETIRQVMKKISSSRG